MTRKVPMRKCVITQTIHPKKDLVRVVLTPEKEVVVDLTGRQNGRGAYLVKDKDVILKAKKSKRLSQALKHEIPDVVYETLLELVDDEK